MSQLFSNSHLWCVLLSDSSLQSPNVPCCKFCTHLVILLWIRSWPTHISIHFVKSLIILKIIFLRLFAAGMHVTTTYVTPLKRYLIKVTLLFHQIDAKTKQLIVYQTNGRYRNLVLCCPVMFIILTSKAIYYDPILYPQLRGFTWFCYYLKNRVKWYRILYSHTLLSIHE